LPSVVLLEGSARVSTRICYSRATATPSSARALRHSDHTTLEAVIIIITWAITFRNLTLMLRDSSHTKYTFLPTDSSDPHLLGTAQACYCCCLPSRGIEILKREETIIVERLPFSRVELYIHASQPARA
jgi:hypothetical protein